jgi:hypothetical protein
LPKNFWADTLRHLLFTMNSIPCRTPGGFISPNSALGIPPVDLRCLHPFGCLVWYKVPEATQKKLDSKGCSALLLSYLCNGNGYCVWDLQKRSVVKSRDIIFDNTTFPHGNPVQEGHYFWQHHISIR